MSSHQAGAVPCPQCHSTVNATVRQLISAQDLPVKAALLQGRLNRLECPHCGAVADLAIPTLYYDRDKGFALVFAPDAPDRATEVRELTRALRLSLPPAARAPALTRPRPCATREALVEAILAADGVTPALLERQTARARLLEQLMQAPSEADLAELARAHDAELDQTFFELLTARMQAAHMQGDQDTARTLLAYRTFLGRLASRGRATIAAIDAGLGLTVIQDREELLARLRQAPDEATRAELVARAGALMDQSFFQLCAAAAEEASRAGDRAAVHDLDQLRASLRELKARHAAGERAALERAAALFAQVVDAPQPDQVLARNRANLDEAFFVLLGANLERARRQGQHEPARALELIGQLARAISQQQPA